MALRSAPPYNHSLSLAHCLPLCPTPLFGINVSYSTHTHAWSACFVRCETQAFLGKPLTSYLTKITTECSTVQLSRTLFRIQMSMIQYSISYHINTSPEYGSIMFFRNAGIYPQIQKASQPTRPTSISSPPWEPQISYRRFITLLNSEYVISSVSAQTR
jgi:hypothetical protein